jgi:hypothetical protein
VLEARAGVVPEALVEHLPDAVGHVVAQAQGPRGPLPRGGGAGRVAAGRVEVRQEELHREHPEGEDVFGRGGVGAGARTEPLGRGPHAQGLAGGRRREGPQPEVDGLELDARIALAQHKRAGVDAPVHDGLRGLVGGAEARAGEVDDTLDLGQIERRAAAGRVLQVLREARAFERLVHHVGPTVVQP